jgi:preprotein translocase subunit SecE
MRPSPSHYRLVWTVVAVFATAAILIAVFFMMDDAIARLFHARD